ncbi:50S ribosomal protein L25/general stress protein Ctc [Candidatus Marithrix sp. Canyon 246]|uniref:50S ribosomal protein L25/general stress protein Ctc n=1 Tax=Candidatus Marithrix sp. Canyon 246 TaxID=1827136 RepID=UPI00084A1D5E|nr:50S ribosomal protein L25/general stress protein Ctc [Candidatus Marithrix sp. Canyon 246]
MENFEINAKVRTDIGKGASRRMRHAGLIPAIIYGSGKDPVSLSLSHNEIINSLNNESFYSHILTVNLDGKSEKAVLKDLQRHPYKPSILHLDLQRVSDTEKLSLRVPLHFLNEENCVGVKQDGGKISHQMTEVEISCLPKDLPEFIEVDLVNVKVSEIVHLSNLIIPENVELASLAHGDLPVASVNLPRGTQEEEDQEEQKEEQKEEQ